MRYFRNNGNRFIFYAIPPYLKKEYGEHSGEKITLTISKNGYYGCKVKLEHKTGASSYETVVEGVRAWTGELNKGDTYKITLTDIPEGFEQPMWIIQGFQIIRGESTGDFVLSENINQFNYSLTLSDDYGGVYLEVWPEEMSRQGVTIDCYIANANTYATREEVPDNAWTELFTNCETWETKTVRVRQADQTLVPYWVKIVAHPNLDAEEKEIAPYIADWMETTESQSWGGGYSWIYKNKLEYTNKIISLSAILVDEQTKNNDYCKIKVYGKYYNSETETYGEDFPESKQLLKLWDDTTWISLLEHNPETLVKLSTASNGYIIDLFSGLPDDYDINGFAFDEVSTEKGVILEASEAAITITGIENFDSYHEIELFLGYEATSANSDYTSDNEVLRAIKKMKNNHSEENEEVQPQTETEQGEPITEGIPADPEKDIY